MTLTNVLELNAIAKAKDLNNFLSKDELDKLKEQSESTILYLH